MKITPSDFIGGEGVKFALTSETIAERLLLITCVDGEFLTEDTIKDDAFTLTLPVSNGE